MGDIKPLPEAIRNSVRSAIILFDMTRVVEELIFNSLDADATKISVAVGAETCYLKISDNGCGITRDGLVLVAERYASSKFNEMEDSHAVARSFGFRGEALSSIANVSLLEILTKTQGRPNGYRKVMKGCKCLHIGIDDGRQDIGTTVIVRDLFYNQPVRRKLIQSSTKKELESVKNCVLRISLVHPKVSFKVVDIESDDELFCSCPSSPLSRVMSAFGVEVSNSLQELNVTDGLLELSGFMSSPCDISSVKAFQYIYINSRYISKGAIHKLLNQLANSINSLQQKKGNMVSQIANQSKTQTCCSFILNLRCPRSWYDVAFESSKTFVDFKDWKSIIGFIEKAITRVWSEIVSHGDALSEGTGAHVPTNNVEEIQAAHTYSRGEAKYRADNRKNRVQDHASPVAFPSPSLEMQSKKYGHLDRLRGNAISCADVTNQNDSFIKSFDEWPATTRIAVDQEIGICDWRADHNVFPNEDQLVGNKYFVPEKYKEQVDFISKFGFDEEHQKTGRHNDPFGIGNVGFMSNDFEKPFLQKCTSRKRRDLHEDLLLISEEFDASLTNKYLKSDFPIDHFKIRKADNMNKVLAEPFLQRCTSRKKRSLDDESFLRSESSDFPMEGLRYKRTNTSLHRKNDLLVDTGLDFRSRSHGFEHDFDEKPWRGYEEYNYIAERGNMDQFLYSDDKFCAPFRGLDTGSDFKTLAHPEEDSLLFHPQDRLFDVTSPGSSAMFIDETKGLSSELYGNDDDYCCIIRSSYKSVNDKDRKTIKENLWKTRLRRSHSAPPFFQGKNKAFALSNHSAEEAEKGKKQSVDNMGTSQEADESKHPKRSSALCPMGSESNSTKDLLAYTRETNKGPDNCSIRKKRVKEKSEDLEFNCTTSVEDYQDPVVQELKWRNYPKIANGDKTRNSQIEDTILNVYSGQLQLAGDLLVPKSISRNFLNNAKVLQQVDKKFIPVVGNGVLAVIDQHAADERIRLEELRQKVLAGEKKSITYLDVEQKLVMPEMGYQLLHTYAEQTQKWGWLFDSQSQDSKSFKKNLSILHKQQRGTTLVAVPCILGVNLTDVDLLEFLQQLADTDGSSTIPPSVHRVLNSKACRGAIMFGDTLLPSECSLIVDELKQTSLCFQCAHGRPTTVPLINLEALQKQIEKLGSWNAKSDTWHGLQRHVPSLERVISRLNQTEVQCS